MSDSQSQIANGHEFLMLPVQGGSFHMGSPDDDIEAYDDEKPQHTVIVPDFYIGKYPVTQALWKAVMNGENPSNFQGDDRPVEQVSWDDVQVFIKGLNEITQFSRLSGYLYRLPTEAEWEYAARGGKYYIEGYKYSGSDRLKDVGWFIDNSSDETKSVGLKYPNQVGIHDMSVNVRELCEDDWHDNYIRAPDNSRAWVDNHQRGARRVGRGGGWRNTARGCRVTNRFDYSPDSRWFNLGFRLALSFKATQSPFR